MSVWNYCFNDICRYPLWCNKHFWSSFKEESTKKDKKGLYLKKINDAISLIIIMIYSFHVCKFFSEYFSRWKQQWQIFLSVVTAAKCLESRRLFKVIEYKFTFVWLVTFYHQLSYFLNYKINENQCKLFLHCKSTFLVCQKHSCLLLAWHGSLLWNYTMSSNLANAGKWFSAAVYCKNVQLHNNGCGCSYIRNNYRALPNLNYAFSPTRIFIK